MARQAVRRGYTTVWTLAWYPRPWCFPRLQRRWGSEILSTTPVSSASPPSTAMAGLSTARELQAALMSLAQEQRPLDASTSDSVSQAAIQTKSKSNNSTSSSDQSVGTSPEDEGWRQVAGEAALLSRMLLNKRRRSDRVMRNHHDSSPQRISHSSLTPIPTASPPVPTTSSVWMQALTMFSASLQQAVTPTTQHINLLLAIIAKERVWRSVDEVERFYLRFVESAKSLREEREARLEAATEAYSEGLLARHRGPRREEVLYDSDDMVGDDSPEPSPFAQQVRLRHEIRELRSVEHSLLPNAQTFGILMDAAMDRGLWMAALGYFDSILDASMSVTEAVLALALRACLAGGALTPWATTADDDAGASTTQRLPLKTNQRGPALRASALPRHTSQAAQTTSTPSRPPLLWETAYEWFLWWSPNHAAPSTVYLMVQLLQAAGESGKIIHLYHTCTGAFAADEVGGFATCWDAVSANSNEHHPTVAALWEAVGDAARERGDWKVSLSLWQQAATRWRRLAASLIAPPSPHRVTSGSLSVAASLAPSSSSHLHQLAQRLQVSALHTLRRVHRYADILALYRTHGWSADSPYRSLWTPEAITFVAQAAFATQNVPLLLELCGVVGATEGSAPPCAPTFDVFDCTLRAIQQQVILLSPVRTHVTGSNTNWVELSQNVYAACIRHALHPRGTTPPPAASSHGPLMQMLSQIRGPVVASGVMKPLWQQALEHLSHVRRSDAVMVALTLDILAHSATSRQPTSASPHPALWQAAMSVFSRCVQDAAVTPTEDGRVELQQQLALTAVTATAVTQTITWMSSHQPFAALSLLHLSRTYHWLPEEHGQRLQLIVQAEAAHHVETRLALTNPLPVASTNGVSSTRAMDDFIAWVATRSQRIAPLDGMGMSPAVEADASVRRAWAKILDAAVMCMQQLHHSSEPATASLHNLIGEFRAAWRLEEGSTPSSVVACGSMAPVIVNAVLQQVMVTAAHRWTLWPSCLELLSYLSSPLAAGAAPTRPPSSVTTVRVVTSYVRCCDRAEQSFVRQVVLDWLLAQPFSSHPQRIDQLPLIVKLQGLVTWITSKGGDKQPLPHIHPFTAFEMASLGLLFESLMWACRHRCRELAHEFYVVMQPLLELLVRVPSDSRGWMDVREVVGASDGAALQRQWENLASSALAAYVVLLQCLSSGTNDEVLLRWPLIHDVSVKLMQASPLPLTDASRSVSNNNTVNDGHRRVTCSLADQLSAIMVKLCRNLHSLSRPSRRGSPQHNSVECSTSDFLTLLQQLADEWIFPLLSSHAVTSDPSSYDTVLRSTKKIIECHWRTYRTLLEQWMGSPKAVPTCSPPWAEGLACRLASLLTAELLFLCEENDFRRHLRQWAIMTSTMDAATVDETEAVMHVTSTISMLESVEGMYVMPSDGTQSSGTDQEQRHGVVVLFGEIVAELTAEKVQLRERMTKPNYVKDTSAGPSVGPLALRRLQEASLALLVSSACEGNGSIASLGSIALVPTLMSWMVSPRVYEQLLQLVEMNGVDALQLDGAVVEVFASMEKVYRCGHTAPSHPLPAGKFLRYLVCSRAQRVSFALTENIAIAALRALACDEASLMASHAELVSMLTAHPRLVAHGLLPLWRSETFTATQEAALHTFFHHLLSTRLVGGPAARQAVWWLINTRGSCQQPATSAAADREACGCWTTQDWLDYAQQQEALVLELLHLGQNAEGSIAGSGEPKAATTPSPDDVRAAAAALVPIPTPKLETRAGLWVFHEKAVSARRQRSNPMTASSAAELLRYVFQPRDKESRQGIYVEHDELDALMQLAAKQLSTHEKESFQYCNRSRSPTHQLAGRLTEWCLDRRTQLDLRSQFYRLGTSDAPTVLSVAELWLLMLAKHVVQGGFVLEGQQDYQQDASSSAEAVDEWRQLWTVVVPPYAVSTWAGIKEWLTSSLAPRPTKDSSESSNLPWTTILSLVEVVAMDLGRRFSRTSHKSASGLPPPDDYRDLLFALLLCGDAIQPGWATHFVITRLHHQLALDMIRDRTPQSPTAWMQLTRFSMNVLQSQHTKGTDSLHQEELELALLCRQVCLQHGLLQLLCPNEVSEETDALVQSYVVHLGREAGPLVHQESGSKEVAVIHQAWLHSVVLCGAWRELLWPIKRALRSFVLSSTDRHENAASLRGSPDWQLVVSLIPLVLCVSLRVKSTVALHACQDILAQQLRQVEECANESPVNVKIALDHLSSFILQLHDCLLVSADATIARCCATTSRTPAYLMKLILVRPVGILLLCARNHSMVAHDIINAVCTLMGGTSQQWERGVEARWTPVENSMKGATNSEPNTDNLQSAITTVMNATKEDYELFKQLESRRRTRPLGTRPTVAGVSLQRAWRSLERGLGSPSSISSEQVLEFFRCLSNVPHTVHFIPQSWTEAVMAACPSWSAALELVRFSLSTVPFGGPSPVQHHLAMLMLRRSRTDVIFHDSVFGVPTIIPTSPWWHAVLENASLTGEAAATWQLFELLTPSKPMGGADALKGFPARLVVEMMRHSVRSPSATVSLYAVFSIVAAGRPLRGVHVFLSLLRCASLHRIECLAVKAMVDFHHLDQGSHTSSGRTLELTSPLREALHAFTTLSTVPADAYPTPPVEPSFSESGRRLVWSAFSELCRSRVISEEVGLAVVQLFEPRLTPVEQLMVTTHYTLRTPAP